MRQRCSFGEQSQEIVETRGQTGWLIASDYQQFVQLQQLWHQSHNTLINQLLSSRKGKGKEGYKQFVSFTSLLQESNTLWDHTVLPAIRQGWLSRLYRSRSWYRFSDPKGMQSWVDLACGYIPKTVGKISQDLNLRPRVACPTVYVVTQLPTVLLGNRCTRPSSLVTNVTKCCRISSIASPMPNRCITIPS